MYRNMMKKIIVLVLFVSSAMASFAQQYAWTRRFYFDLDRDEIRYELRGNRAMMDSTAMILRTLMADTTVTTLRLDVISSSSLEASNAYNSRLTARRTSAFLRELRSRLDIPYHVLYVHDNIFDWDQLYLLTANSQCPEREKALRIIRSYPTIGINKQADDIRKSQLQQLAGGATYDYMMKHLFPSMRNTTVTISASHQPEFAPAPQQPDTANRGTRGGKNDGLGYNVPRDLKRPRAILGVKTNMLYDVAATPNIGIEFYVAPQFTIAANWAYAWWHKDSKSRYWRAYGGDLEARYYFRKPDGRKDRIAHAFQGHHVGLYGALCTYDFEFGNNGQQGAKWNYGGGISYGYSLPIAKRLNLDFTLGLGCLYGDYYTYEPSTVKDDDYYWTATKQRKYWGPTKAEISLVWVLGK